MRHGLRHALPGCPCGPPRPLPRHRGRARHHRPRGRRQSVLPGGEEVAVLGAAGTRRVLIVSTYDLGHQPALPASAAAVLTEAGHDVRCRDTAVEMLPDADIDWAETVVLSVPMHTATRLAAAVLARIRARRGPEVRVVLAGLYAAHGARALGPDVVDAAVAGEVERELLAAVEGRPVRPVVLDRLGALPPPRRDLLPAVTRYGRLRMENREVPAGYVELSRGCVHRCGHCPVPVVYDGRIRVADVLAVVADAVGQWDTGVRHLTVGDPDALNAPPHTLRALRRLHAVLPELTVDLTVKIEHLRRHAALLPELRALGVVLVTTAVESAEDTVLDVLCKGHVHADTLAALADLRAAGIEPRPSLLPFTPWSTLAGWLALQDLVATADLQATVDPVQLSIRLLLPDGSLLLHHPAMQPHLTGMWDASGHGWRHPDPAMDRLAAEVSAVVATAADAGEAGATTHARLRALGARRAAAAGIPWSETPPPADPSLRGPAPGTRPALTESWFCCAEPTALQVGRQAAVAAVSGQTNRG